jgi:hypothetical protein
MHHAALFLNETPNHLHHVDNGIFDTIACLVTCTIVATSWIFALLIMKKGALDGAQVLVLKHITPHDTSQPLTRRYSIYPLQNNNTVAMHSNRQIQNPRHTIFTRGNS